MLIEQIIELELKGPGPLAYTPITAYFHDKTKISKENLGVDYYLLLKYYTRQCTYLTSPYWAKSLTKFDSKMQDFKRVLDLNCK